MSVANNAICTRGGIADVAIYARAYVAWQPSKPKEHVIVSCQKYESFVTFLACWSPGMRFFRSGAHVFVGSKCKDVSRCELMQIHPCPIHDLYRY